MLIGIHTPPQNVAIDALRDLWRRAEALGFGWISISDHFDAVLAGDAARVGDAAGQCHEAVAAHTLLATETQHVRCGSLVYCAAYRQPTVIANAIVTIDSISGGRADLGLGAGWLESEFAMHGFPFLRPGQRLDMLEESVECVRRLLAGEEVTFHGRYFHLDAATVRPRPVNDHIPLWIGGGGERRTVKIVARWADGWNLTFVSPEDVVRKRQVLEHACSESGRDAADIQIAVNTALAWTDADRVQQYGAMAERYRPNMLGGSDAEVVDRIGAYIHAGVDLLNLTVPFPADVEALERFAAVVGLTPAPGGFR